MMDDSEQGPNELGIHERAGTAADELRLYEPLPEPVLEATRALYSPPAEGTYWEMLDARIMARVIADARTVGDWWQILGGWARGGLIAAAAVLAIVATLLLHERSADMRATFQAGISSAVPTDQIVVPAGALSERDDPDSRGATFHDVIAH